MTMMLLLVFLSTVFIGVHAAEIGKPHSTVIALTGKTFDEHINDPANGLWLLKFYAPWCGHCKKLEPVLNQVAPFLTGKMAIGKIDCTVEKALCKRFEVRGYPTLKYYRDTEYHDYPSGRDADSIITFGEKMSDRAVQIISTYDDAKSVLLDKFPVAFIAYDPDVTNNEDSLASIDASGATDAEKEMEKFIQSNERTRVFGQVARRWQAQGSFGLLSPNSLSEEIAKFFEGSDTPPSNSFIARIEVDVPIKLYTGEITSDSVSEFVTANNLPVVVELGGHNFRFAGRKGKPLAIGVYDPNDEVKKNKFRQEMKEYATRGAHKDGYVFGTMDGKKWDKFLGQFSITKESLPELFVLDVPKRVFWQDSSVFGVSDFINAIENGEIEAKEQEARKKIHLKNSLIDL
ncbi:hypothetical protein HJC23_005659 [Cyclotella cryptica]|uniref:Thioredoxin domain-containing protein n=1 Tax=Cyclotella cryptica TaxID=29204 RepID=A0ABD3PZC3_9STRA